MTKKLLSAVIALMFCFAARGDSINVKEAFGAKGDGVADDTVALQTALNYLHSWKNWYYPSATNEHLYIPPGVYWLTGSLMIPPSLSPGNAILSHNAGYTISGGGMAATKLVWSGIGNGCGLLMTNEAGYVGVTIEDLTIVGPQMSNPSATNTSIGLAIGYPGPSSAYVANNTIVRNCGIMGWGYGAAITNQWGMVIDNCVVGSNTLECLRFAGSHGVSIQNCRIMGGGWSTCCGIGIGFHPPENAGYGDNDQVINCVIFNCTNGIVNNEVNLTCINNHLERCGSYYTLFKAPDGSPAMTTIIGGYILDNQVPQPQNAGFPGMILMDSVTARNVIIQNYLFQSSVSPARPTVSVTNDGSGYAMPTYIGAGSIAGLWNNTSKVTVCPLGKSYSTWQLWKRHPVDAVRYR